MIYHVIDFIARNLRDNCNATGLSWLDNAYGICHLISREEKTQPVFYKGFDDYIPVGIEDTSVGGDSCVYFRILSNSVSEAPTGGRGCSYLVTDSYSVKLVAYADGRKFRDGNYDTRYELIQNLKHGLFQINKNSVLQAFTKMRFFNMRISSVNDSSPAVFSEEYAGHEMRLSGQHIFISMNLDLELRYDSTCLPLEVCLTS